ncbi:hypothetical protein CEXT_139151 [Caerostris extrusa]|uniref:Uncharacterized protein n=1 Tax=Caerostris extrusa TaxID=172846 RepID=A0AAV4UAB9_CAEEX|nr:hypothetical protein CEXT_139151 [Caerostris extrusa]
MVITSDMSHEASEAKDCMVCCLSEMRRLVLNKWSGEPVKRNEITARCTRERQVELQSFREIDSRTERVRMLKDSFCDV